MPEQAVIRPTKKQRELLEYIRNFIAEHGYSPCYREIMRGCDYNSVATVALHVNNLISRGHLRKRDRSARSLEIVDAAPITETHTQVKPGEEKWLVGHIQDRFARAEAGDRVTQDEVDALYVLVGALKILGLDGAAMSLIPRLAPLRSRVSE